MRQSIFAGPIARYIPPALPEPLTGALEKVLALDRLHGLYDSARRTPGDQPFCEKVLNRLNVQVTLAEADKARLPSQGPVIVVANHPFGMIEGVVLAAVLLRLRPDVKLMANHLLAAVPELRPHLVLVDPFGQTGSTQANRRGMRESVAHLGNGGMLVVFPAGEVSRFDVDRRAVTDRPWSPTVARLVRLSRASVLPAYFDGINGPFFHLAGLIHPLLRTAMLPHELLNKHDRELQVLIGTLIPHHRLAEFPNDGQMTDFLRRRTYLLANRKPKQGLLARLHAVRPPRRRVVPPVPPALLEADIALLPPAARLVTSGDYDVYIGTAAELPHVLREIARLREITFRDAGEGTGKPLDTDSYDAHYRHLFLWNRAAREIVGAYRLGATREIRSTHGVQGLYTSELFAYTGQFLDRIGDALEMGRSFVRAEYQKNYNPLLLLWRGIATYVARNPRYHVLFGPVSISNDYCGASRQLIVQYLQEQSLRTDLAALVKPRNPFRGAGGPGRHRDTPPSVACSLDELSAMITDMEVDRKGVPVLLRQYLKLGGKLAGFHVDNAFSRSLDGLIVVDLRETDPKVLERYMGAEGCAAFRRLHQC